MTKQRFIKIALFFVVLLGVFFFLGREYQEHQRLEQSLADLKPLQQSRERLRWLPDDTNTARALELYRREEIQDQYLRALEEIYFSSQSGQHAGLKSYFQGAALSDATQASQTGARLVTWRHRLKLHFYAPDGATIAFTDQSFVAESLAPAQTQFWQREMDVVMRLDDGNWRIHHWRVTKIEAMKLTLRQDTNLAKKLSAIRGINYVGRNQPFLSFWQANDPEEVRSSFAAIKRLKLNTIRVFIPYPLPPNTLEIVRTLLTQAQNQQLQLIITLLDTYTSYQLEDLPKITAQFEQILPFLRHQSVFAIDLKNEAERDAQKATWGRIRDQLSWLAIWLRNETKKPITVGLTQPDFELSRYLDFVTIHHYGTVPALEEIYQRAKQTQKPILLEEFGFHTQLSKLPDPHTELEQAAHYQAILQWTAQKQLGFMAWTLHDFPIGAMPNAREVERHLGVMRQDGTLKPAARVLLGETATQSDFWDKLGKLQALLPILPWVFFVFLLSGLWFSKKLFIRTKKPYDKESI